MKNAVHCRTLGQMLYERAQAHPDRLFMRFDPSSSDVALTYGDAWTSACRWADLFASLGVPRGRPALLALPNGADFVGAFFGASLAGLVPAPTIPRRTMTAHDHREFVTARVNTIGASVIVTAPEPGGPDLSESIPVVTRLQLEAHAGRRVPDLEPGPALLQFTSGTTGRAKAVQLNHDAVLFQASVIAESLRVVPEDTGVSWLPLFHDMGLFGFLLTPAIAGASALVLRTETFARRPREWMETISRERATITSGPPSAYVLAARCARPGIDLTSLRVAVVGAERILPASLQVIHEGLGSLGLSWSALVPAYGMAEVGAAITMTPTARGPRWETIDASRCQRSAEAAPVNGDGHTIVSCGLPVTSTEIRIVDEAGRPLPERRVGQITVKSPSQTTGHIMNRALDTTCVRDGWLFTGDQGYMAGGELFVTGRLGELLIVAGEKYVPEEFEQAALSVQGVHRGRVVAVGHPSAETGAERVTLLVETGLDDEPSRQLLTLAVRQSLSRRLLPVADVILVPPKTIERTPNGKLPRSRYRERLLAGEFRP